jgi:M6 family metalloprotease-like protein
VLLLEIIFIKRLAHPSSRIKNNASSLRKLKKEGLLFYNIDSFFKGGNPMNKKIHILILSTAIFSLVSCQSLVGPKQSDSASPISGSTSSSDSSVSTSVTASEIVIAQAPVQDYSQYDLLDLSDLKVQIKTGDVLKDTTDYSIYWVDTGKVAVDKEMITRDAGKYKMGVSLGDLTPKTFTVTIWESTNFNQSLSISALPTKKTYSKGDAFDPSGMVVLLKTSYVDVDGKKQLRNEVVTDKVTYSNADGDALSTATVFSTSGSQTISVSYALSDKKTLTATFSIFVRSGSTGPETFTDDTITFSRDDTTITLKATNSVTGTAGKTDEYYSPDQISMPYTIADYGNKNVQNWHNTPQTGKVPLLIVPVVIPGDEASATEENYNLISKAFFGKSSDLHYESLHSYYYKASYGGLDFTGAVTDYFYPGEVSSEFKTPSSYTSGTVDDLAVAAAKWASETAGYDLTQFDSDKNGMIDGMWLIYLHAIDSSTEFWAYNTTTGNKADVDNPVVNNFGWAGLNFLNDKFASSGTHTNSACDAHVVIHETGHMLGVMDYYSYSQSGYDAVGKVDMMSNNINDHNPYTKLIYGWVKPYIVYGNATITIKSCQWPNTMIIYGYDDKKYSKDANGKVIFNPFDEYLVADYFTNQGLNAQGYDCYYMSALNGTGGRLYHVDNRLAYYDSNIVLTMFADPDDILTTADGVIRFINNSEAGSYDEEKLYGAPSSFNKYDEIRWISADKRVLSDTNVTSAASLFGSGDTFTLSDYSAQFPNKTTFDNGKKCSYSISF